VILAANNAASCQYGYAVAELLGLSANDLLAAGALAVIGGPGPEQQGERYRGQTQHRKKDGTSFEASITCHALLFEGHQAVLSVITDVTESTRAERALRASEERYRRIVETAAEGVWLLDADDITSYVNQRMADMLGYSREEMMGRHVLEFVVASAQADTAARLKRHRMAGGEQFERILRRKNGTDLPVFASTSPVRGPSGEYEGALAMVIGEDIELSALVQPDLGRVCADPIAVLTAFGEHAESQARSAGADEVCAKPCDTAALLALVNRLAADPRDAGAPRMRGRRRVQKPGRSAETHRSSGPVPGTNRRPQRD
jgi:PAS domain S-box-containing protein